MKSINSSFANGHPKPVDELEFCRIVDQIRATGKSLDKLVDLLHEQNPVYADKSMNAVVRMRGYLYYSFYLTGVPKGALRFIYEELQSGREAYSVAAAAISLRKSPTGSVEMATLLLKAIENIRLIDNYVSFETYYQQWPLKNKTSAIKEILLTIRWLGQYATPILSHLKELAVNRHKQFNSENERALKETVSIIETFPPIDSSCCGESTVDLFNSSETSFLFKKRTPFPSTTLLQDHDGDKILFKDFFKDNYSIVAFFYTRCENPLKCSLTISNLGALQNKLLLASWDADIKIGAITYDPFHDLPYRLKIYTEARGMKLSKTVRTFRADSDFEELKSYFDLGVNYAGEVVNRHIIELYLLNKNGKIIRRFRREQMNIEKIYSEIKKLVDADHNIFKKIISGLRTGMQSISSAGFPILVLFLPKCPFCFAAYFGMLGITASQVVPFMSYLFPLLIISILTSLYFLYRRGVKRNSFLPLYLCIAGSFLVVFFGYIRDFKPCTISGLCLLFAGTLLNSLPFNVYRRFKDFLSKPLKAVPN